MSERWLHDGYNGQHFTTRKGWLRESDSTTAFVCHHGPGRWRWSVVDGLREIACGWSTTESEAKAAALNAACEVTA